MTTVIDAGLPPSPLAPEKWDKIKHLYWVFDPYFVSGNQEFNWRDWWMSPEPPSTPQSQSYPTDRWRHPTFEEACARQDVFNTDLDRWRTAVVQYVDRRPYSDYYHKFRRKIMGMPT